MYTIKAILWSYANGQLTSSEQVIFSAETQNTRPVAGATGSFEISEGGSIQFVLAYTHPLYDSLVPLETYVTVTDDSEEIFYGRILSKSDPTFTGQITYTAEGALSFLHDGEVPPEERNSSGQQTKRTLTAEAFFRWCIERHNATVSDPRRQFTVGSITIDNKNETKDYQVTSYIDTRSAFDQYLRGIYGGYLRARRVNGTLYIDWLKQFDRLDPQAIELGVNVQSLTSTKSADGIYTVLRPVGDNGLLLDSETIDLFPAAKMATMGRIVKSVTFSGADTKAKLQELANDYIGRLETVILGETSIKLIDMHYLDGTIPKIRIGDRFDNIHGNEGTEFTVAHMDVDFLHCENDSFSFKNRKDLESNLNGGLSGGTLSGATSRGARSSGLGLKYYHEFTDEAKLSTKKVSIIAEELNVVGYNTTVNAHNYERMSRAIEVVDGIKIDEWPPWEPNHAYVEGDKVSVVENNVSVVENNVRRGYVCKEGGSHTSGEEWDATEKEYWNRQESTQESVTQLWGTEVIQNSHEIANVAGNFIVLTDFYEDWPEWIPNGHQYHTGDKVKHLVDSTNYGYTCTGDHQSTSWENDRPRYWIEERGRKAVQLINGASMVQDDLNGNMITVAELAGGVENYYLWRTEFVGTALWTQRDNITGVAGQFDVETDPVTGIKTIVIKSGGGMKIRRNNVEYGLYDQDNLTGGLLVSTINDAAWPAWAKNTYYAEGATVMYEGTGYICKKAHTSVNANSWDAAEYSKWRPVTVTQLKGDRILVGDSLVSGYIGSEDPPTHFYSDPEKTHEVTKQSGVLYGDIPSDKVYYWTGSRFTETSKTLGLKLSTMEGIIAQKATIGELNAQKARIDTLETNNLIINGTLSVSGGDIYTSGNINAGLNLNNYIRGKTLRLIGSSSSQGAQEAILSYSDVDGMIIKAEVASNTLRLWKHGDSVTGDPSITFSKATTLTGAWGSGADADKFIVTASPQGNQYKYSPPLRLNGRTDQPNFSAEVYYADGSSVTAKKSVYGYLVLGGSTSGSYVEVNANAQGTGTGYARLSVGTLYTNGYNSGYSTGYSAGKTYEYGIVRTRFNAASGSYYIEAYENVSGVPGITNSGITYKLATSGSTSSTKVIITNPSGTQFSSTPELPVGSLYTSGQNAVTLNNPTWTYALPYTSGATNTATVSTTGRPTNLSKTVPVTLSQGSWSNGAKTVDITTTNGSIVARTSVSAPSVSITFDCDDLGNTDAGNDKPVKATAKHGSTTLGENTQVIHMHTGNWSGGRIGVTSRLTDANGKCIDRIYISAPTPSISTVNSQSGTFKGTFSRPASGKYLSVTVGGSQYTWLVQ